jgi:hypothetical protein
MATFKTRNSSRTPANSEHLGRTPDSMIAAAYALAKAPSAHEAIAIMNEIPAKMYPALAKHMKGHPHLFAPDVLAAVAKIIAAPRLSAAEALFA